MTVTAAGVSEGSTRFFSLQIALQSYSVGYSGGTVTGLCLIVKEPTRGIMTGVKHFKIGEIGVEGYWRAMRIVKKN